MIRRTGQAPWRILEAISMVLVFAIGAGVWDTVSIVGVIAFIFVLTGRVLGLLDALSKDPDDRRRAVRQEAEHGASPPEETYRHLSDIEMQQREENRAGDPLLMSEEKASCSPPPPSINEATWNERYQFWEKQEQGLKGEYDPDSEQRWGAMASVSTAAGSGQLGKSVDWSDEDYTVVYDEGEEEVVTWDQGEEAEDEGNEDEEEEEEEESSPEEEEEEVNGDESNAEQQTDQYEHFEDSKEEEFEYVPYETAQKNTMDFERLDREVLVRHDSEGYEDPLAPDKRRISYSEEEQETESSTPQGPPQSEDLKPFTSSEIDDQIEIRHIEGKGRCCFARRDFAPGEIIFIELPTLAAIPSIDTPLWEKLSEINEEEALDLPPIWHLAALYSLTKLPKSEQRVLLEKWVPGEFPFGLLKQLVNTDKNKAPSRDLKRILAKTQLAVDAKRYERYLQVWRYNSFGHHVESDGLVLYNRISMLAHDCLASACWHYGENDAFVLRARHHIKQGQEITISYVGDDDLYKSTNNDIAKYLEFETAYITRLEETDKTDLADAEAVYAEAQRVFSQHWVLYLLDGILFDAYRENEQWMEATMHQTNRIQYATQAIPHATFTLAWLHEERGDAASNSAETPVSGFLRWEAHRDFAAPFWFLRNLICQSYETAMNMMIVLTGWHHSYTISAGQKLNRYQHPESQ
ncbi:uncharacterized protein LOC129617011 [Condylostylus longicornis]|uniref:uncharacterized protein LOC129617011 n=1 Tax=Condylostylus longicornis TaxID=2530218 RepID=UPI00244DC043|nr:uncharacterized protein LOC129617011 [Condylostylus longicornis]